MLSKKGFLQIDVAFAVFIFFTFFLVIYGIQSDFFLSKNKVLMLQEVQADSRDICFLLTRSEGVAYDWEYDLSTLRYVGLKNHTGMVLNFEKINSLSTAGYFEILNAMKFEKNLYVNIQGMQTNSDYLMFGHRIPDGAKVFSSYTCYSFYNDEFVSVYVEVWK